MALSTFIMLCNHHHCTYSEPLSYQTKILYPLKNNSSLLLAPAPSNLCYTLFLWVCLLYVPHICGIIQYWFFCILLISLCIMSSRFILVMYQNYFIPFKGCIIFHCKYIPHFIYLVICQCTSDYFHFGYCE